MHSMTRFGFPPTKTTLSVECGQHSWNNLMVVWVFWRTTTENHQQINEHSKVFVSFLPEMLEGFFLYSNERAVMTWTLSYLSELLYLGAFHPNDAPR